MTAAAMTRSPQLRPRRRNVRGFLAVLVLFVLLAPVVYLFTQLWTSTGSATATTTSERSAVAYSRPVSKLLAALVDTQYAAVRGARIDPSSIRSAIDDVNAVDHGSTDPLQIRQRWAQLPHEIDNALNQNTTGPDALRTYAAPIALTQALLNRIADSSRATTDPGPGSYQLTQVALRNLPDVVVNAGQVSALAFATDTTASSRSTRGTAAVPDPRLTIAEDRLAQAANDVSTGLRAGTDPGASYAVDLNLLGPLDEFAAAADELSQTAAGLVVPGSGARDRIDAANTLVKTKALALEGAVLSAFDAQLVSDNDGYDRQRQALLLATAIIVLAAVALLWLRMPKPVVRYIETGGRLDEAAQGRHSYPPPEGEAVAPDLPKRIPDLVDARDLLPSAVGNHRSRGMSQEAAGSR
jgi:hypothetical protein